MMRGVMHNRSRIQENRDVEIKTRNALAEALISKWEKKKGLGFENGGFAKIYEASPAKARNLAIALENQERHLKSLTETQISDTFQSTPQTVVKVIRLGYPNSVRGDIFVDHAMQTMKDTMYKIEPTYDRTKRGATAGDVMYESSASRYASEINETTVAGTGTDNYTGTLVPAPMRPFSVKLMIDGNIVAADNGAGTFVGAGVDTVTASTINYSTGVYDITFAANVAVGSTITIQFMANQEFSALYGEQGQVKLNLVPYDLRATPFPIGFSWSKMAELLMDDALSVDAEEALITAGSDELKKSLDYFAIQLGYRASKWTAPVEFDTDFAAAGADSDYAHTQAVIKSIENAGNKTYEALKRGEVTHMIAGSKAVAYLKNHKLFTPDNSMPAIGAYKVGTLDGKPLYKVDSSIIPTNEIVTIYRNNQQDSNDAAITLGTYIPMYRTQTLEYSDFYKETAIAHFGAYLVQEPKYITSVKLLGL